jgi:lysophospholipase L1-like esterase
MLSKKEHENETSTRSSTIKIVQMGDSYSSGTGARDSNGVPNYENLTCFRSDFGWGGLYARQLEQQVATDNNHNEISVKYSNIACYGAKIPDTTVFLDALEQLPFLDPQTDLVLLTVGGNDANFLRIVIHCFLPFIKDVSNCQKILERSKDFLRNETMVSQLTQFLLEIRRRTKNDTKVVYLQYPYLVLDNPEWAFTSNNGASFNVDFEIRNAGDLGDSFQRQGCRMRMLHLGWTLSYTWIPSKQYFIVMR